MGFLGIGGSNNKLNTNTTVALTNLGKQKVESATETGLRYRIIETLDTEPMTISGISRAVNAPPDVVANVCKSLMKSNYIHTQRGEE